MEKYRLLKKIKHFLNSEKVPVAQMIYSNKMLEGKTALITGGSSGIGFSIAEEFIKNGCKVIICGRNENKLKECVIKLGEKSRMLILDVNEPQSFEKKINEAISLFENSQIDILVNSAGIGLSKDFFDIKYEDWNNVINTNLRGTFFITQSISKYMIKNKIKGNILNISSSSAVRPAWTPYEISKWGIKGFTLGAADTLSRYGITVNAIAPGPTATPMLNKKTDDDIRVSTTCNERMALPNEIASLAVYMCSDIGKMIIGDTVYITGGAGNIINRFE